MLRAVSPFILLVFLAASFPATLAAQEKTALRYIEWVAISLRGSLPTTR